MGTTRAVDVSPRRIVSSFLTTQQRAEIQQPPAVCADAWELARLLCGKIICWDFYVDKTGD